jgi:hypothetical protein
MAIKGVRLKQEIIAVLDRVEQQYSVHILCAVESGSRAWGFASQDSDYDVRFIYANPRDWYLSVFEKRDVIERVLPARMRDRGRPALIGSFPRPVWAGGATHGQNRR